MGMYAYSRDIPSTDTHLFIRFLMPEIRIQPVEDLIDIVVILEQQEDQAQEIHDADA